MTSMGYLSPGTLEAYLIKSAQLAGKVGLLLLTFHMRTLKHREVLKLARGHRAGKKHSQNLNSDPLNVLWHCVLGFSSLLGGR